MRRLFHYTEQPFQKAEKLCKYLVVYEEVIVKENSSNWQAILNTLAILNERSRGNE